MRKIEKLIKKYSQKEIDPKLMIFGTRSGIFSDNAKYLYLYFLKNTNYRVFFVLKNHHHYLMLKDKIPVLNYMDPKSLPIVLKAGYYFVTHDIDDVSITKNEKTKVINLWHGTGMKKMGFVSKVDMRWIDKFREEQRKLPWENWYKFCISHDNLKGIFQDCCHFRENQLLISGLPRTDILFENRQNPKLKNNLKNNMGLPIDKKVILYAPTFRDRDDYYSNDEDKIIKVVESFSKYHKDKILLLRTHPLSVSNLDLSKYNNVINANEYWDMQELLLVADVLISDYSSVIFDYSILRRPILLYVYDFEEYSNTRGLWFKYDELFKKYKICYDVDELMVGIEQSQKYIDEELTAKFLMPNACANIHNFIVEDIK